MAKRTLLESFSVPPSLAFSLTLLLFNAHFALRPSAEVKKRELEKDWETGEGRSNDRKKKTKNRFRSG